MRRDLIKTLSFATVHFSVGFSVAYALTGSVVLAGGIALIEPLVNTVAFFLHERAWGKASERGATVDGGSGIAPCLRL